MKKIILILLGVFLLSLVLVSADVPSVPDPTHKDIPIVNNITNINDFPDYVFVAYNPNPLCQPNVISSEGIISSSSSNRCVIADIYAIKKTDFNENLIHKRGAELHDFLNSSGIKVLDNVELSRSILLTDTESIVYNSYEINLSQVQTNPVKVDVERSYSLYYYLLIPIIALIIVIIILAKRRKNRKKRR